MKDHSRGPRRSISPCFSATANTRLTTPRVMPATSQRISEVIVPEARAATCTTAMPSSPSSGRRLVKSIRRAECSSKPAATISSTNSGNTFAQPNHGGHLVPAGGSVQLLHLSLHRIRIERCQPRSQHRAGAGATRASGAKIVSSSPTSREVTTSSSRPCVMVRAQKCTRSVEAGSRPMQVLDYQHHQRLGSELDQQILSRGEQREPIHRFLGPIAQLRRQGREESSALGEHVSHRLAPHPADQPSQQVSSQSIGHGALRQWHCVAEGDHGLLGQRRL